MYLSFRNYLQLVKRIPCFVFDWQVSIKKNAIAAALPPSDMLNLRAMLDVRFKILTKLREAGAIYNTTFNGETLLEFARRIHNNNWLCRKVEGLDKITTRPSYERAQARQKTCSVVDIDMP